MTKPIALILGATGNLGAELARQMVNNGWHVRALHRSPVQVAIRDIRYEWIKGDAMNASTLLQAAQGADVIVHAVNPPGYHNWQQLVLPMIDNSIKAAKQHGARIVLPGTLYNYGPDAFPCIDEQAAQKPQTKKGTIRAELEKRLFEAAQSGVKSLIVRAGDFFGPGQGNNWFNGAMVKPNKPFRQVLYPGIKGVGHQWAYIPDVATTIVQLLQRQHELAPFECFHMGEHWDPDGQLMLKALMSIGQQPALKIRPFPWWILPVAGLFSEMLRELKEMRYLWTTPVRLNNQRLTDFLGHEPHTPWHQALAATLGYMGCLDTANNET